MHAIKQITAQHYCAARVECIECESPVFNACSHVVGWYFISDACVAPRFIEVFMDEPDEHRAIPKIRSVDRLAGLVHSGWPFL